VAGTDQVSLPGAESERLEAGGRWLRLAVRSTMQSGAAWFDPFGIERHRGRNGGIGRPAVDAHQGV